jgi:D-alanyl-D-alanine carboxypeptidase (penicillin-binding protein 5/6)
MLIAGLAAGSALYGTLVGPWLTAQSAILVDEQSGLVLYAKDADKPRRPASTTKILTAMLLIEHCLPDEVVVAPKGIEKTQWYSSMNLKSGEKLTVRDLLYGIMLRSANDAAQTAAIKVAGSVPAFAEMMNEKAKALGCTTAHFVNPHGLDSPEHLVSARDLAIIGRAAMKLPIFREIASTRKRVVKRSINLKDTLMVTRNKWLLKDETADGIKTGFTTPAGQTYVGSATREGWRAIDSLMKAKTWQVDHGSLLTWAYQNFEPKVVAVEGELVGTGRVEGSAKAEVPFLATGPVRVMVQRDGPWRPAITFRSAPAPQVKGDSAVAIATYPDGQMLEFPVTLGDDAPAIGSPIGGIVLFGGGTLGGMSLIWLAAKRRVRARKTIRISA